MKWIPNMQTPTKILMGNGKTHLQMPPMRLHTKVWFMPSKIHLQESYYILQLEDVGHFNKEIC